MPTTKKKSKNIDDLDYDPYKSNRSTFILIIIIVIIVAFIFNLEVLIIILVIILSIALFVSIAHSNHQYMLKQGKKYSNDIDNNYM